jgi:hypothetical protein
VAVVGVTAENPPVPFVVHATPVATVKVAVRFTVALFAHTDTPGPIVIVGAGVMVVEFVLLTALQLLLPVVVKVRLVIPAVISAAVGVYVAFIVVVLGEKAPAPDHIAPVATVNEPLSVMAGLLPHTGAGAPAFTVGLGVMVTVIGVETPAQLLELPVVVNVSTAVPAAISAAEGI